MNEVSRVRSFPPPPRSGRSRQPAAQRAARPGRHDRGPRARGGDRHPDLPGGSRAGRRRARRGQLGRVALLRVAGDHRPGAPARAARHRGGCGRAAELARRTPGIQAAEAFSKAQSERLLEPWLGTGLDFHDLPVPRLIVIKVQEGADPISPRSGRPCGTRCPAQASTTTPSGSRGCRPWRTRSSASAWRSSSWSCRPPAWPIFATRGAMAGNREIVEVLHFVGANDDYIAREFQRRFFELGLEVPGSARRSPSWSSSSSA